MASPQSLHDPAEDATTEAILDAALREFGTRGFRGTSLSRVAANAGVSRPTLYARYADKAALFRAVVQSGFDAALAGVEAAAASKGPVEEELRAILEAYFGHLFDRYHGLPEIDELSRRQLDEAQDLVDAARARFKSLVSRWVRARRASARGNASLPAAQAVDLICLSPYALKDGSTSRVLYHKRLAALAQSVAAQLR